MSPQEIIRGVVRGERSPAVLNDLGIRLGVKDGTYHIEHTTDVVVAVDLHDIATGLLHHCRQSDGLRIWAFVVQAADFIDFDPDLYPDGETIMDAIWRASFGESIPANVVSIAERLLKETPIPAAS